MGTSLPLRACHSERSQESTCVSTATRFGLMTENGICPPEFAAVFHAHADVTGAMTFARFMEIALYDPQIGYYRRKQPRVGYGAGTDFFTASTSGSMFGELVVSA